MRVLVLGGNGFIGSHVVDSLLAAEHQVRVFDRAEDRYRGRLPAVEYVIGDFREHRLLSEALTDMDVVFHGIGTTVPSTSNLDPVGDVQGNLVATLDLLRLMLENGNRRIVFLSSGGTVYGRTSVDCIAEDHALRPICSYGVVKLAIEHYLYMFQELSELRPLVLRPSNPYGERQGHSGVQGIVGTFLNKIARKEQIEIWGDGSAVRDFIYVGDLAHGCLAAIESQIVGTFNVGSGHGYSIREVLETIAAVCGVDPHPKYLPARRFDVDRAVLDISKARGALGWSPKTTLLQGVSQTWVWARSAAAG